jgi:uncharacterized membrane protein (TIGR02234 family)
MSRRLTVKQEYGAALLAGAVGAGLILLAVKEQWAQAVFTPPKPLSPQVVGVSGEDLVPLAGALALAALAGLAAVIATRGVLRRVAGALLAVFGASAGVAVTAAVTAASVVSVAASNVASPESAAVSGQVGSTTSGSSGGSALVVSGSAGHAIMSGTPWRVAVLAGALLIFLAGLATVLRGPRWPVMSARYELPRRQPPGGAARSARPADSASMWESLSGDDDPTEGEDPAELGAAEGEAAGAPVRAEGGTGAGREDRASVD